MTSVRVALAAAAAVLAGCGDSGTSTGVPDPVDTTEQLVLLAPNGGMTYHLGDTVPVSLEYRNSPGTSHFVTLWFSPDNRETMDFTLFETSIRFPGARLDTEWVIPADSYYVTGLATVRVEDYTQRAVLFDWCDTTFAILP